MHSYKHKYIHGFFHRLCISPIAQFKFASISIDVYTISIADAFGNLILLQDEVHEGQTREIDKYCNVVIHRKKL